MLNSPAEQKETLDQIVNRASLEELEAALEFIKTQTVFGKQRERQTAEDILIGAISLKQQRSLTQMRLF